MHENVALPEEPLKLKGPVKTPIPPATLDTNIFPYKEII